MKVRWIAIIALSAFVQVNFGSAARAQLNINPFSAYYDNVARAAAKNDAEAVRRLVGGGDGSPNQVDDQSRTAMHYAAVNGNLQIMAILIKANAKLNLVELVGRHTVASRRRAEPD